MYLYKHSVSIICGLVEEELPIAGAAKFEMCVVIRFLCAEGQPAIWNSINWSLKIQNGVLLSPLSMNWAELHF